jgi:SMI1 / KNR4 family (SUKH-1)
MTMATTRHDRKHPTQFNWRTFLKQFSRDLLSDEAIRETLPKKVISSAWLGYKGASDNRIADLEKRLDMALPPSYRSFLAETDGWRNCGAFIYNMWPCSEVRWFRERNQQWIDAYVYPEKNFVGADGKPPPPPRALTDRSTSPMAQSKTLAAFEPNISNGA